jgi:hypothetical protein
MKLMLAMHAAFCLSSSLLTAAGKMVVLCVTAIHVGWQIVLVDESACHHAE